MIYSSNIKCIETALVSIVQKTEKAIFNKKVVLAFFDVERAFGLITFVQH